MHRKDSENIKLLESARPEFDRLTKEKIRADAEVARYEQDLEKALAEGNEIAGTNDENQIRQMVLNNYDQNTKDVDAFLSRLEDVSRRLAALD